MLLFLPYNLVALRFIKNFTGRAQFRRSVASKFIKDIKVHKKFVYYATADGIARYNYRKNTWSFIDTANSQIPSNYVTGIATDGDYIWFSTVRGVARYNPAKKSWVTYRKKDGLADDETTSIAVDDDYVWVGTRYWGISRFDKRLERWRKKPYTPLDGLGANRIYAISVEGDQVWAATDDGLSVYDRYTDLWFNFDAEQGLSAKQVTCIASDGKGIWCGTYGGGLNYFDKENQKFKVYRIKDGVADDVVFSVATDGNLIWAGTFSGVSRFDKKREIWKTITKKNYQLVENTIVAMAINGNRIWLGSDRNGVTVLDKSIPQAVLTSKTGYTKPGRASIFATIRDRSPIRSVSISYRISIFETLKPSSKGIYYKNMSDTLGKKRVENLKIAEWDIRGLKEGLVYDIYLKVVNKKGQVNETVFPFVIDNSKPVLNVSDLPVAVKDKFVYIRGNYIESYLKNILIRANQGRWQKAENIQRKTRSFSHRIKLMPGKNKLSIKIEDVGKHTIIKYKNIIFDNKKPVIIIQKNIKKGVSSSKNFTIKGRIKEDSLDELYYSPGKNPITVKKDGQGYYSFSANITLNPGFNAFKLIAIDKTGAKDIQTISINFNTDSPSIKFDSDLAENTKSRYYTVKGSWSDKDLREIIIEPGNVRAEIDYKNKTFQARRIKLDTGFNIVKATAIDEQDNRKTITHQVVYEKSGSGDLQNLSQSKDASENYKLYTEYKKKYDELLIKYKSLLLTIRGGDTHKRYYFVKGHKTGRISKVYVPGGNSVFFVKYNRRHGDTMKKLATLYLGNPNAQGMIARFNNDTPIATIKKRGTLLLPNNNLIKHILTTGHRSLSFQLIDIVSESFNSIGPNRAFFAYKHVIAKWLMSRGMIKPSQTNPRDNIFSVMGKYLLYLSHGGNIAWQMQKLKLKLVEKKAVFGYIIIFRGSFLQFIKVG